MRCARCSAPCAATSATPRPQPTLADLEALLARARQSGIDVELTARGERRPLPAGIELAAYRVVQHALEALPERGTVHVGLRYLTGALELEIRGPLADGAALGGGARARHGARRELQPRAWSRPRRASCAAACRR